MKKSLIFAGAIFLTSNIAFAKTIDFDTPITWNSNVVESALDSSGFEETILIKGPILLELLKKESFSVYDATRVCLEKCELSNDLKEIREKCPKLCYRFAWLLINENNRRVNLDIMNPDRQDSTNSYMQGSRTKICMQLSADAQKQGLTLPVLCGGKCNRFGNDKIIITDNIRTIEFTVDDFCEEDNVQKEKEYYMIIDSDWGIQDVTSYPMKGRLVLLNKAQSKPASEYLSELEKRPNRVNTPYDKRVETNGYCRSTRFLINKEADYDNCWTTAKEYAQQNACKLFNRTSHSDPSGGSYCGANWSDRDIKVFEEYGAGYTYKLYNDSYTPTYQECLWTFDELMCNSER